jgi:hypothetical protein
VQLVIDEIGPDAATPLQAVKLLAVYLSGGAENKVGYLVSMPFRRHIRRPDLPLTRLFMLMFSSWMQGEGDIETERAPG